MVFRVRSFVAAIAIGMGGLASQGAWALEGDLLWAQGLGNTGIDLVNGVTTDASGNVYTTGGFAGTVDFDAGAGVSTLTATGFNDIFVAKSDPQGNFLWARAFLCTTTLINFGNAIAVDSSGNVYTTGVFAGTVDFDPGAGTSNLAAGSSNNIFVSKLDTNGDFVWAKNFGSTGVDEGRGIAVDGAGNVHIAGFFSGTFDFDLGAGTTSLTSAGGTDAFVLKLDSNGDFAWVKQWGSTAGDEALAIALDASGNVLSTGRFRGTNVDLDPGAGTDLFTTPSASFDIFVSKLDQNGGYVWARQVGGATNDQGLGIVADNAGNVFTTGEFTGTPDFDTGAGTNSIASAGSTDMFVLALDASGTYDWAITVGDTTADNGRGIALDSNGNVFVTGGFSGAPDFNPGGGTNTLTSAGNFDAYVLRLDNAGGYLAAFAIGGTVVDHGNGIASDAADNFIVAGRFNGTADFDPSPGSFNLTSGGSDDAFVAKIAGPDVTPPSAVSITASPAGPTNAASVNFTVTFDEVVTDFDDASDVIVTHFGTADSGVSISGGPTVYTVTVSGISGDGTVSVQANTGSDVVDLSALALAASVTGSIVIDNTAPVVLIDSPTGSPISSTSGTASFVVYTGTTQTVSLDAGDVTLSYNGSAAGGTVNVVGGNSFDPTVEVSGVSGDGSVQISIAAGISVDAAGNASAAAGPSASAATVDNTGPTASSVSANPATASSGEVVEITFLLNEFASGDPDLTVNGNPAVRTAKGSPIYTYEYTVLPGDPLGAATIVISGVDALGNAGLSANMTALTIVAPEQNVPVAAWPVGLALLAAFGMAARRRR